MRHAPRLALLAAMALGACSGGGLTTGSLLSGVTGPSQPPAPVNDPTARAMHVAAVSARATKCGYNFDPTRLREAFLASEARQGLAPPELAKVEKTYDFTRGEVAKRIAGSEDYCDAAKTAEIKGQLTKTLAGDFTAPAPKAAVAVGPDISSKVEPMDRERIFDPTAPSRRGILSQ